MTTYSGAPAIWCRISCKNSSNNKGGGVAHHFRRRAIAPQAGGRAWLSMSCAGEGVWWRIHGHVGGGAMDGRIYATTSSRRHCQIHHPTKPTLPSVCSAWWCLYLIYNISMLCTNNENTGNTPHLWTRELIHMGVLITRTLTNSFIYVLFLLCVQTNQIFLLQIEHEEQQIPCNHAQNLMQNIYRQMLHTPFEGNDLFSFM